VQGRTNRRDLLGKFDSLRDDSVAGLNRALQVDLANLFAQISPGLDQSDETVLDNQVDICPLFDRLLDSSVCLDDEFLATVIKLQVSNDYN
jgi:hypothetical protein